MLKKALPDSLFLGWNIYAGFVCFVLWLSFHLGLLVPLFKFDPTKITYVISAFFLLGTLHCGIRARYLSKQINAIINIENGSSSWRQEDTLCASFLLEMDKRIKNSLTNKYGSTENTLLAEVLSEQAHAQHEVGWFFTGLLVKLGLLGTVIGFILMLQPLSTLESFDIKDIQNVLTSMTAGMSIALNTTLVGLIGSMLLGLQYLLLDRGANELVVRTIHYMETELLPN